MHLDCRTDADGTLKHTISTAGYTFVADQPVASGGEGAGPGPHEYFDAALAACKSITAMMYAKARGMKLDRVHITIDRDSAQEKQGLYILNVKVGFEGALSDEERAKLLDITTRCPVHKLMTTTDVDIRTSAL